MFAVVLPELKIELGKCKGSIHSYFKRMRKENWKGGISGERWRRMNLTSSQNQVLDYGGLQCSHFTDKETCPEWVGDLLRTTQEVHTAPRL